MAKDKVLNIRADKDLREMIEHHAKQIGEVPSVAARQLMRRGYEELYDDDLAEIEPHDTHQPRKLQS